jgi:pimeloyl-ACP methyl ester carboxylesterase
MKQTAMAVAALCLAACGDPAPAPAPEVTAAAAFPDQWFMLGATNFPTSEDSSSILNLHETAGGPSGYLGKAGEYFPVRNVQRTDKSLTFTFLANGATYHAELVEPGRWRGEFAVLDPEMRLSIDLTTIEAPPERLDFAILPDGRRMHIVCAGEGTPVVVLDYGAGGTVKKDWGELAARIASSANTRVCAYDRAGRGLSDPSPTPRTAAAVASDMEQMLAAANIAPPYVLAGHSLGSYHVRQFANAYADKTAGLVLIDPSGDGQVERFNAVIPKVMKLQQDMFKAQAELNCIGRLREAPVPPNDPLVLQCGGNDPEAIWATKSEIEEMPAASTQQLLASRRSYGDMPLIVLTRTDYEKDMPADFTAEDKAQMRSVWETMHAEMAALSTRGEHRFVAGASHYIQRDAPDAVIAAITDVVAAVRAAPK